ncbi:MAG: hypothetical protein JSV05_06200 [Candidatus Bathyarchaeota archaeon]|nr:MAG: hypothetical protein JSV05_06200 [Candidatus Bathyarchaeota archaeon]
MPTKIGKIQKPLVAESKAGRKLYCIPLLFSLGEAPREYAEMFSRYWDQVKDHLDNLEKIGTPHRIFYEMISLAGEEGMRKIQQQNERTHQFVKSRIDHGAVLVPLEDETLFMEYIDWGVCLSVVRSPTVAKRIFQFYKDAEQKRDKKIATQINDSLENDEAAILLMRDENRIRIQPQFSPDIQVYLVHPPILNDLHNWLRDHATKIMDKAKDKKA